eukprot:363999-Chlamydomonas_euryale.AAC.7
MGSRVPVQTRAARVPAQAGNVRARASPVLRQRFPAHPHGGCRGSHEWSAEPRDLASNRTRACC